MLKTFFYNLWVFCFAGLLFVVPVSIIGNKFTSISLVLIMVSAIAFVLLVGRSFILSKRETEFIFLMLIFMFYMLIRNIFSVKDQFYVGNLIWFSIAPLAVFFGMIFGRSDRFLLILKRNTLYLLALLIASTFYVVVFVDNLVFVRKIAFEINPNYLGSLVLFYLYLCSVTDRKANSQQLIGYGFIIVSTIVLTFSRKFLVVALPWLLSRVNLKNIHATLLIIFFMILLISYNYDLFYAFLDRMITLISLLFFFYDGSEQSVDLRGNFFSSGIRLFADKPVFGYGLMGFEKNNPLGIYSHNTIVEILVNYGLIGFILFFAVFAYAVGSKRPKTTPLFEVMFLLYNVVFLMGSVVVETTLWWFWLGFHFSIKQVENVT